MSNIITEIGNDMPQELREAVIKELKDGHAKEMATSAINHARMEKVNRANHKSVEGLGRLRMRIDNGLYHTWGQKYGYNCWRDNGFLKEVERDNPEVRVKCGGTKLQFGFTSAKKYSKNYGEL